MFVALTLLLVAGCVLRWREIDRREPDDRLDYFSLGQTIAEHGVFGHPIDPNRPYAYRLPLYPAFISIAVNGGAQPLIRRVILFQIALALAMIVGLYALGAALGGPLTGLAAAGLYALLPEPVAAPASVGIEFFYSAAIAAASWALAYWAETPSPGSALAAGLMVGISLACRSPLFLFPPLLWLAARALRRRWPRLDRWSPRLVVAAALTLIPWTLRNAVAFREFVPFERGAAAVNLFTGSLGIVGCRSPGFAYAMSSLGDRTLEGSAPDRMNAALVNQALFNVLRRPGTYLWSCLRRLALIAGVHPWLGLLALVGLWRNRGRPGWEVLGLLLAYFWSVHALMSVDARYMIPATPVLCVLAAGALAGRAERPEELRRLRAAVVAIALFFGVCYAVSSAALAAGALRGRDDLSAPPFQSAGDGGVFPPREDRRDAKFYNDRGVYRYARGDADGSIKDFRAALALSPNFQEALLSLAAVEAGRGDRRAALRFCDAALKAAVKNPNALGAQGDSPLTSALDCRAEQLEALGRPAEAEAERAKVRTLFSRSH